MMVSAILVAIIGSTRRMNSGWVAAAMIAAVMANSFLNSLHLHAIRYEINRLNLFLGGEEEMRPEIIGTVQRLLTIAKELGYYHDKD